MQCAPPDQVVTPYLRGTERYALLNLHEADPNLAGHLPGIMLGVAVERPDAPPERFALALDGLHFDLRPGWERAVLTWLRRMPMPRFHGARLTLAERIRLAPSTEPARAGAAA